MGPHNDHGTERVSLESTDDGGGITINDKAIYLHLGAQLGQCPAHVIKIWSY